MIPGRHPFIPTKPFMSPMDRAIAYNAMFPNYAPLNVHNGIIYGVFSMGNNFAGSGYYGSFPGNLLNRISAIFPDIQENELLHLFSGSIEPGRSYRFDRKIVRDDEPVFSGYNLIPASAAKPLIMGEAEDLFDEIQRVFDGQPPEIHLIIADPPYTGEDAHRYGTVLCNRQKVFHEAIKTLQPMGHLVWFDQVKPMWSKLDAALIGEIGVTISSNHRIRGLWIYEKRPLPEVQE
jgi:hypothetical protein